jgi:hypothetical protein
MGFSVLPTNIGGFSLSGIAGPLASLLAPDQQLNNLYYPSDLGSNPAMGHAVIIQAYDYTTGLTDALSNVSLSGLEKSIGAATTAFTSKGGGINGLEAAFDTLKNSSGVNGVVNAAVAVASAPSYAPLRKTPPVASVSLFMPENLNVSYNSSYSQVSITKELGIGSYFGSAYSDIKNKGLSKNTMTPYAAALGAEALNTVAAKLPGGTGSDIGALALQGAGIYTNPQIQLLYQGTAPREFTLEFLLTPKTSAEAQTIKNICDTFAFYSLPGVSGGQNGQPGQFLTPPQVFTVQFKFLGDNSISGVLSNVITKALNSSGLGFLTQLDNPGDTIKSAPPAKVMTVNDCFLSDVNVDYAPNGWAAYNDGHPVQTKLTLTFKETTMITKNQFKGSSVAANYNTQQAINGTGTLDNFMKEYNAGNVPQD